MSVQTDGHVTMENDCGKVSPDEYNDYLRNLSDVHWSIFLLPSFKSTAEDNLAPIEVPPSKTTFLYGSNGRLCPAKYSLSNQDNCPVHYVLDHDKNRIPENTVRVKCNCKRCRHGSSMIDRSNRCELVYTYTPVWRRSPTDCTYIKTLENVSVACNCKTKQRQIIDL